MEQKWIAVSKTLPLKEGGYLGHVIASPIVLGEDDSLIDVVTYRPFDGVWTQHIDGDDEECIVSHWMELPSKPVSGV
jgi:hypothetical protein